MPEKIPYWLLSLLLCIISCGQNSTRVTKSADEESARVIDMRLQKLLDSAGLEGAILVYDAQKKTWFSNSWQESEKGYLPASTFKIPNTIIGLETGILESDSHVFVWDGKPRMMDRWNRTMNLHDAFHLSCVPCYQELARKVGVVQMEEWLEKIQFGNMVVDTLDKFWLNGTSKISAFQQVEFLKQLYNGKLPVKPQTISSMKKLMVIETTKDYTLSGKTGWAMRNGQDVGWFVGYLQKPDNTLYYFVTRIVPKPNFNMDLFPSIRSDITFQALSMLKIIE